MELFLEIIPIQYLMLIGGLMVIGEMLKKFTVLPNKMLTIVLPCLGAIVCTFAYICDSNVFLVTDLINSINKGLCCGFASTGGYELLMNTFVKKDSVKKVISICEKVINTVEEEVTTEEDTLDDVDSIQEEIIE